MSFSKYISALLPSLKKDTIRDDIANLRKELKENTIPPFEQALEQYQRHTFKNAEVQSFIKGFDRDVRIDVRGNFIVVTNGVLLRALDNLDVIEKIVEKYYNDETLKGGMTFVRVNALRYIETISFLTRYSRTLLLWAIDLETLEVDPGLRESVDEPLVKAEKEWLVSQADNFYAAVVMLSGKKNDVEKKFEEIPDIVCTPENISSIERTVGVERTDPFKSNFISPSWNPIYRVRMANVSYQVDKYHRDVEQRKQLELRLLNYKQIQAGSPNARTQALIGFTQDNIQKLSFKIAKFEEGVV